jgi:hypothetical protein
MHYLCGCCKRSLISVQKNTKCNAKNQNFLATGDYSGCSFTATVVKARSPKKILLNYFKETTKI